MENFFLFVRCFELSGGMFIDAVGFPQAFAANPFQYGPAGWRQ
jgi:hypothetical protein